MITYPPGSTRKGQHIFPECVSEHASGGWLPTKGKLHKLLRKGEYDLIGDARIFEGTFVQVTKKGEFVGILNHPNVVILGILASTPAMLLPDLMVIARDKKGDSKSRKLEITRLIPLELMEIYVHSVTERRLKIYMATGRTYYLQLCAPQGEEGILFERWMRLIYLLHLAAGKANLPSNVPSKDVGLHTIWKTASMPSDTQYLLPVIMDKGSSEEMKKWSSHPSSSKMGPKPKQSAVASRQGAQKSKSGALQSSSQQRRGILRPEAHTRGEQPSDAVFKDPSQVQSQNAAEQSGHEVAPRPRRFSTCKPCAHSPPPSGYSIAVAPSESDTASVAVGPSVPFTLSEAVGPSQPLNQLSAQASSQGRSVEPLGDQAAHEGVTTKGSLTEAGTRESEEVPVKLGRSQKSRYLVPSPASQLSQQKVSQSGRNAPNLKKPATEAQAVSQGSARSAGPLTPGKGGLSTQSSSRKQSRPVSKAGLKSGQASSRSARPLTQEEGGGLTIQSSSRKQSQPVSRAASTRAPSASAPARSRMSAAVGSSEAYTRSVAIGPLVAGAMSVAAGPSQPASRASRVLPADSRASPPPASQPVSHEPRVAPERSKAYANVSVRILEKVDEGGDKAVGTGTTSREMPKPSEKQGTSAFPSGVQKSVVVGPSQPFLGDRSRPHSRTAATSKSVKLRTIFCRTKSKDGDKTRPSSATEKKEPPREQRSKSKSRLKNVLSSAKKRSSLTVITLYSVLSSPLEKLRSKKSKEDYKLQEQHPENISSRTSKHVTISGVIGPSGKGIQLEEHMVASEMNMMPDEFCSTTAMLGSELGNLSTPQSSTGASQPSVVESEADRPASPPKLGGSAPDQIQPSSRPPGQPALSKDASANAAVRASVNVSANAGALPSKSTASADMGTSGEDPNPAMTHLGEQEQPSGQSQQQNKMADGWMPSHQPSADSGTPDRSHVSVGVGPSAVVETKSAAVGPSARGGLKDAAAGPSAAKPQGEPRIQTQQQSKVEDGRRPGSQPSAAARPPDTSRISVGVGRSVIETKSAAVGPSVTGSRKKQRELKGRSRGPSRTNDDRRPISQPSALAGPPDRSRVSVGVGRSVIETKSVSVGRSRKETVTEGAGPSRPGSEMIARTSQKPETSLQDYGVFQPPGWLGTVEIEDTRVFKAAAAATPGPSSRASRALIPSGGLGSRAT